ncbi:hypothetical protein [Mucilaginibacter conchicola]|nr:hypothetical protein [Mucilaginibacter conchicola]
MKFSLKTSVLLLATLFAVSCKKDSPIIKNVENPAVNAALGKQIAMAFYQSGNSGLKNVSENGVKAVSARGPIIMDYQNTCGQIEKSNINTSNIFGDTTRTVTGNRVFTYLCDGYYHNSWNIDAYRLQDTVTTTETGTGFKNIYNTSIDYHVKSLTAYYSQLEIEGATTSDSYKSKVINGVVSEYNKISISYNWKKVAAQRPAPGQNPVYLAGEIEFTVLVFDKKGNEVNNTQPTSSSSGYMQPWANNTMRVYFNIPGSPGKTKAYQVDMKTGEVTELNFQQY